MGAAAGLIFYYAGMKLATPYFLHGMHVPAATITTDMEVAADGTMLPGSPTASPAADAKADAQGATDSTSSPEAEPAS